MLSNRNCFKLLVKMISAFPICSLPHLGRGIADRSVRDHHVRRQAAPPQRRTSAQRFCVLTILPPVTALAVGLPAQRAIAQRFRALAPLRHADCIEQCPLSGVTRKTFAPTEFFSV